MLASIILPVGGGLELSDSLVRIISRPEWFSNVGGKLGLSDVMLLREDRPKVSKTPRTSVGVILSVDFMSFSPYG
jgi:hypothetical protein